MLVLTRRLDEQILVGDHIRITVIGIQGKRVRLGIAAPAGVVIRRTELCESGRVGRRQPRAEAGPRLIRRSRGRSDGRIVVSVRPEKILIFASRTTYPPVVRCPLRHQTDGAVVEWAASLTVPDGVTGAAGWACASW
jgi:carbon storage regulator CsrA